MEPSVRQLNPFVRDYTRRAMKIPVFDTIEGCSWPGGACETRVRKQLIESSVSGETFLDQSREYSLKSLDNLPRIYRDESEQCAVGPEFQNLFTSQKEIRTVADAFTEWIAKSTSMTRERKLEFSEKIAKMLKEDIQRRTRTLGSYVLYFSIALLLLLQQYAQSANLPSPPLFGSPFLLTVVFLVPLISTFYLHTLYSERLRNAGILHTIPILLLVTYAAYSIMVRQGSISSVWKYVMTISQVLILVLILYVFLYFRAIYDNCHRLQTGSKTEHPNPIGLLLLGSIVIPVVLILWMSHSL